MRTRIHAVLRASEELAVCEVSAGLVVGPSSAGVVGQGPLEQFSRLLRLREQGPAGGGGGPRPRPPGALGEGGQLVDPGGRLVAVAGADGGVDPVERGHAPKGWQAQLRQVVNRVAGVAVRGSPRPLAQRVTSATGPARMPSGWVAVTSSSRTSSAS